MNILILGGTGYIAPHLVRLAVSRGHKVTTFTRGRRKLELPPEVIQLLGDRNGQLQALEGKAWDAVIDDSATNPEWVRPSCSRERCFSTASARRPACTTRTSSGVWTRPRIVSVALIKPAESLIFRLFPRTAEMHA